MSKDNKGTVYLIPTIIAPDSIEDTLPVSIKVRVQKIDFFLVENVRTTRRFISALQINKPIDQLHFEVLDKKTPPETIFELFQPLYNGHDIGILSEAGCPGIADPGALAVHYAHQHNIKVVPLVGPSSILLALMASGFSGQSFTFHGYLPIDKFHRIQAIKKLEKLSQQHNQTQIFMETPYRNNQLLEDLLQHCNAETFICIARDITGANEYIRSMKVKQWRSNKPDLHKVPTVFLLNS